MSGSGNDFIVIDNRQTILPEDTLPPLARLLCCRSTAVGADGLLLLEDAPNADFRMRIINADGSEAEMCGNGARCMAVFIHSKEPSRQKMTLQTMAGLICAQITPGGARVQLTDTALPRTESGVELNGESRTLYYLDTGVPHTFLPVEDLETVPVNDWGRAIRHHSLFQPAGTNVDFITRLSKNTVGIRTYERGVEGETLACGTGATAAALIASTLWGVKSPVKVETRSGDTLDISFQRGRSGFTDIYLEGPATPIYTGQLNPDLMPG